MISDEELFDEVEAKLQASIENEERLRNETNKLLHEKEENDVKYKQKIISLEKALKNKMDLLIAVLKDKGENHRTRWSDVNANGIYSIA